MEYNLGTLGFDTLYFVDHSLEYSSYCVRYGKVHIGEVADALGYPLLPFHKGVNYLLHLILCSDNFELQALDYTVQWDDGVTFMLVILVDAVNAYQLPVLLTVKVEAFSMVQTAWIFSVSHRGIYSVESIPP